MGLWVCAGSEQLVRPWAGQVPGFAQRVPEHPRSWFSHGWAGFCLSRALPLALHGACAATAAGVTVSCGFSESLSHRGVSSLDPLMKGLGIHRFARNSLSGVPGANRASSPCRRVITN